MEANKSNLSPEELLKKIKRKNFKKAADTARGVIEDYDNKIVDLLIENLIENPYQPRLEILENEVIELADSIKENGLIQPVAVTQAEEKGKFYIIAGHRRVEACKRLGKKRVRTIVIGNQDPQNLATKAIIENLQRKDLNIIELAMGLKRYKDEFHKSVEEIAKEIGKDTSIVYKIIGVLKLPDEVVEDIRKNQSTKDVTALSMINHFANKIKKITNQSDDYVEKLQTRLYFDFLSKGRKWLSQEIKQILDANTSKTKSKVTLKKEKKRVTFAINIPELPEDKIKEIEEFIKKVVGWGANNWQELC